MSEEILLTQEGFDKIVAEHDRVDPAVDQLVEICADLHVGRAEFERLADLSLIAVTDGRNVRFIDLLQRFDERKTAPDTKSADFKLLLPVLTSFNIAQAALLSAYPDKLADKHTGRLAKLLISELRRVPLLVDYHSLFG